MTPVCETITLDGDRDKNIIQKVDEDGDKILTVTQYLKLEKMSCIVKISVPEKYSDYSFMLNIEPAIGYYQPWVQEMGKAILNFRDGVGKKLVKKNSTSSGVGVLTTSFDMAYGQMKASVSIAIPELFQDMILSISIIPPKQLLQVDEWEQFSDKYNVKIARC